jgi:hypothetical protein
MENERDQVSTSYQSISISFSILKQKSSSNIFLCTSLLMSEKE